ncbi:MAG: hypothetical protein ACP5SH_10695 [Syntrophobacteraceae bacterium]
MKSLERHAWAIMIILPALICALLILPRHASAVDIRAKGNYVLAPNGDASVSIKLTPSMALYEKLHQNLSNLYLVLRVFASSRADWQATDKKATWDDAHHTMDFSMKMLGAAKNLADHWELKVPKDASFINLDKTTRTFYFNEAAPAGPEVEIRGVSRLHMPEQATRFKFDASRHVVTYVMPEPVCSSGRNGLLLVAALVFAIGGAIMTAFSFRVKV